MLEKFDVVVVGAGTAGCLAAKTMGEKGLKVCLIDAKQRESVGQKICGDALGEHHLDALGLEKPKNGALEKRIEGIKIFSPDLKTVFTIAHEDFRGFMLNRHLFGQWLLNKAIDSGATFFDSTKYIKPIITKKFVTGILANNVKQRKKIQLQSNVVIDASGFMGIIRRALPEQMGIENQISNEDVEVCYREIRQLEHETETSNYCEIYLNQKITSGGYIWIFPANIAKVNVGLGVCMREGFPNPKTQFNKYVLPKPRFNNSKLLDGGTWYDPTRRPLDNMVGNGIVIIGDAAYLVNPIHGGGIGPSMLSGNMAGETIVGAFEKNDFSKKSLWSYNFKYMNIYGKKQASLDIFRLFLLNSCDEDLNYGMNEKLLTADDVLKAGMGEDFHLNISEASKRLFRGLRKISFLNKLRLTVQLMKKVKAHYSKYPETPDNFENWRMKTIELFAEAKK